MSLVGITPNPKYFSIHGKGEVGGKYEQLILKLDDYLGAGFGRLKAHILSMEFVSDYLKRCGAEKEIIAGNFDRARELILSGKFTQAEFKVIEEACRDLGIYPALVVRNSAFGDASGTGMLGDSKYAINNAEQVAHYVKEVIASYFTADSALFRRDACLAEGIAVGIEAMVCEQAVPIPQSWEEEQWKRINPGNGFAPVLSGFAYTSRYVKFEGMGEMNDGPYVGFVRGLSGRYMMNPKLGKLIDRPLDCRFDDLNFKRKYGDPSSFFDDTLYFGQDGKARSGKIAIGGSSFPYDEHVKINMFFGMLAMFEEKCGERHRVEFALKNLDGKPTYHITQVNDSPQSRFEFNADLSAPGLVGVAKQVQGNGDKTSRLLVRLKNDDGKMHFDRIGERFILVMDLADGENYQDCIPSTYGDLRKAMVLGTIDEKYNTDGGMGIISDHLGGILHMADKIFMVFKKFDWEKLEARAKKLPGYPGLEIYEANFRVVGSDYTYKGMLEIKE